MRGNKKSKIFYTNACIEAKLLHIFALTKAEVAQLVELQPSKLVVASSSLVFRSTKKPIQTYRFFLFYQSYTLTVLYCIAAVFKIAYGYSHTFYIFYSINGALFFLCSCLPYIYGFYGSWENFTHIFI